MSRVADTTRRAPLFARREVRRPVAATFTGTLAAGAAPIGLVLLCRAEGLSYPQVGIVLAGEAAGLLVGGPFRGRAVDRRGARVALVGFAIANTAFLALLLVALRSHAPVLVAAAGACAASATFPPFTAVLRDRWALLLPQAERHRGFAAQAVLQEAVFVVGPMASTAVAALAGAWAVIPLMVACTLAGMAGLVASEPAERPLAARRPATGLVGALASPGVRVVVLTHVPMGLALGAIELTTVAVAEGSGQRAAAGVLVAVFSFGSAAGGVAWSRRPGVDPQRAFPRLAAAFCLAQLPLLAATSFWVALPLMVLSGLSFAPFVATVYALLDQVALPGTTAEATTWLTTAMGLGAILGSAIAGVLAGGAQPSLAFAVAGIGGALALLVTITGRRALAAHPPASPG